jgi:hypothetical protein
VRFDRCALLTILASACTPGAAAKDGGLDAAGPRSVCNAAPCGGGLTGTWSFKGACNYMGAVCRQAPLPLTSDQTITFRPDGTFATVGGTTARWAIPAFCVGGAIACPMTGSPTCAAPNTDGSCKCSDTRPPFDVAGLTAPAGAHSGKFAVSGMSVTFDLPGAQPVTADYCSDSGGLFLHFASAGDVGLQLTR